MEKSPLKEVSMDNIHAHNIHVKKDLSSNISLNSNKIFEEDSYEVAEQENRHPNIFNNTFSQTLTQESIRDVLASKPRPSLLLTFDPLFSKTTSSANCSYNFGLDEGHTKVQNVCNTTFSESEICDINAIRCSKNLLNISLPNCNNDGNITIVKQSINDNEILNDTLTKQEDSMITNYSTRNSTADLEDITSNSSQFDSINILDTNINISSSNNSQNTSDYKILNNTFNTADSEEVVNKFTDQDSTAVTQNSEVDVLRKEPLTDENLLDEKVKNEKSVENNPENTKAELIDIIEEELLQKIPDLVDKKEEVSFIPPVTENIEGAFPQVATKDSQETSMSDPKTNVTEIIETENLEEDVVIEGIEQKLIENIPVSVPKQDEDIIKTENTEGDVILKEIPTSDFEKDVEIIQTKVTEGDVIVKELTQEIPISVSKKDEQIMETDNTDRDTAKELTQEIPVSVSKQDEVCLISEIIKKENTEEDIITETEEKEISPSVDKKDKETMQIENIEEDVIVKELTQVIPVSVSKKDEQEIMETENAEEETEQKLTKETPVPVSKTVEKITERENTLIQEVPLSFSKNDEETLETENTKQGFINVTTPDIEQTPPQETPNSKIDEEIMETETGFIDIIPTENEQKLTREILEINKIKKFGDTEIGFVSVVTTDTKQGLTEETPPPTSINNEEIKNLNEKIARLLEDNNQLKESLKISQETNINLELKLKQENESFALKEAETEKKFQESLNDLNSKIAKLTNESKSEVQKYRESMEEYESILQKHVREYQKVKNEHTEISRNLSTLELAFSDVHSKYERCKKIVEGYKSNEEVLLKSLATAESNLLKSEKKYEALKTHAKEQIEKSNKDNSSIIERYESEIHKLTTLIKRLEIKISSLQELLDQKQKECTALTVLCDEVTGKVGK